MRSRSMKNIVISTSDLDPNFNPSSANVDRPMEVLERAGQSR
jgi:hypothetical protein